MTMNADGTGTCDRCGRHLPNTGVGYSIAVCGMTSDGYSWYGHICTMNPNPCSDTVFNADNLADLVSRTGMPDFFHRQEVNPT